MGLLSTTTTKTYLHNQAQKETETMTSPSDTATIVNNLNAGWRNHVCDAMKLDRKTFQLAQGTLGLQTADSSGLFRMADAVPPATTVASYDASTMNKRSDAYTLLLAGLLPETNPQGVQLALGDYYTSWVTWKCTPANKRGAGESQTDWLQRWADQSPIDPGQVSRAKVAINAAARSPLGQASDASVDPANYQDFTASDGSKFSLPRYTATNANAQLAINSAGSASINFDSKSMDTSYSGLFVAGSVNASYWIFSASASASFDQQNAKAAGSQFTISGNIKFATLTSGPTAWYNSAEVKRAFNGKGDAQIWDPGASAGGWDSFFAQPNGALARYVSQLVLVTDYSITVTSKASYSQSDFQQIKTQASFGVWPFFSASESSTQSTSYTLNSDSSLSVTHTLGKGLIQIWGVTVQPAP
jgi:hypothetical protein